MSPIVTDSYRLRVYDRDGVTLRDTVYAGGLSFTDEWRDFGSAGITAKTVQSALATNPFLLRRALVKVGVPLTAGGPYVDVFAFLTAPGRGTLLGPNLDADREWSPAGVGATALLDAWRVYPEVGLTQKGGESRIFGWPSAAFSVSTWSNAEEVYSWLAATGPRAGYPGDWPDRNSMWIRWPRVPGDPRRRQLFRRTLTLSADTVVRFYASSDETRRVWIDGVEIDDLGWSGTEVGYTEMQTYDVALAAGAHTIAVNMISRTTPIIGDHVDALLFCAAELDATAHPARILLRSNSTWKVLGITSAATPTPGMTAGHILLRLIAEAQARGVQSASWYTPTFTASLDSNGNPWALQHLREWEVGTKGGDVTRDLMEMGVHVEVAPDMTLNAYPATGTNRTATVSIVLDGPTANATEASWDGTPLEATTLMGLTAEGWFEQTQPGAAERVEGWLETGESMSVPQGRQVADATLPDLSRERFTFTATVAALPGFVPYVDYFKGDIVTGFNVNGASLAVQIVSITALPVSDDGAVLWGLELEEAP